MKIKNVQISQLTFPIRFLWIIALSSSIFELNAQSLFEKNPTDSCLIELYWDKDEKHFRVNRNNEESFNWIDAKSYVYLISENVETNLTNNSMYTKIKIPNYQITEKRGKFYINDKKVGTVQDNDVIILYQDKVEVYNKNRVRKNTSKIKNPSQSKFDSIDVLVENYMSERKIPGFTTCMVKDNKIIWHKSYGLADIPNKKLMSMDGIMNIGSVSKTFTAIAAMQLWEKGLIDLDTDINEYLGFEISNPNCPNVPITIFQILTHTSSIKDGKAYHHSYACGDPTISLNDWIDNNLTPEGKYYYVGSNFGNWSPGTKDEYSNVAFGLLGLIIEKVAKQPFNDYCKENIFEPLNMNNTGWLLSEIDTSKHIRPYAYVFEEDRNDILENKRLYPNESEFAVGSYAENCLYSFPNYPDGLVRTSVKELSQYLIAIMNGGEYNGSRILKSETLNKMLLLQIEGNNSQGLCWHTFEIDSTWGHTGGDPGIATYLIFNPKNKIGIITFQNNCVGGQMKIIKKLYQIAEDE